MRRYSPRFDEPPGPWRSALLILALGATVLLAVWLSQAAAFDVVVPSQHGTIVNSFATSTAANALTFTLTPTAAQRVRLYSFSAFCSAGAASASVTNAGVTLWLSDAGFIGASVRMTNFAPPLTGPLGGVLTVTISSCGGTAQSKGSVQADLDAP